MRAFHMSWLAFFLCFFAWFGIAPLMAVIRDELNLTKEQVGNTIIASVTITIIARLVVGWLCDKIGPRLAYTWLLLLGSLPVMGIGFAESYTSFLLFRLAIGAIGASFVITQYHTSVMFAPNCVGTANATTAGWGNLGGGVTQMIMPLIFAGFVGLGYSSFTSWRLSMVLAGALCFVAGIAYFFLTTDYPGGNRKDLIAFGELPRDLNEQKNSLLLAAKDHRVWALFIIYGACFGVELTINNIAALYFKDFFDVGLKTAGLIAGLFGLMNIFARTLGGAIGDRMGFQFGLKGRARWLFWAVFIEGFALLAFSRLTVLPVAIGVLIFFSLFVQMSEGATYSVVPFINKKAMGSVAGIIGAGGNMGAVGAALLFRSESLWWNDALTILGFLVVSLSFFAYFVTFSEEEEKIAKNEYNLAIENQARANKSTKPFLPLANFSKVNPMDILRIFIGCAIIAKGIYFILHMQMIEQFTEIIGPFENISAWLVVLAHTGGGLCLVLGFFTRPAALINALILAGAILFIHVKDGLFTQNQSLELSMLTLVSLCLIFWHGSGHFSFDTYFQHKKRT